MKLSEVIKAVEDGNKNTFINNGCVSVLNKNTNYVEFIYYGTPWVLYPLDGWKEVKPPRQWSEKELALFKLLPKWTNWISKDSIGKVYFFENKPVLSEFYFDPKDGNVEYLTPFDFLTITFEESPVYIGGLKGEQNG